MRVRDGGVPTSRQERLIRIPPVMSRLLQPSSLRLRAIGAATFALAAGVLSLSASPAGAAAAGAPLVPYIIGGQEASIAQFPWQVYVESEFEENGELISASC